MSTELSRLFLTPTGALKDQLDWKTFSKALLNATKNGVFAVDGAGTIIISNRVVQKIFGLFPGSLLKTTLPEFWPRVEQTLKDQQPRTGIPAQKGGASFLMRMGPILWKATPVGVLCILDDRTELEKITHEMHSFQELTRELDAIIGSSNDGLWVCDADAVVTRINAASERMNNIRADEVVGRSMEALVEEGFVDRSVTLEVIRSGRVMNILQTTRDGRKLMLIGSPVFDDKGELFRVVVNERDITEIDNLRRGLEEQEAIKDGVRRQMLEMQLAEVESNRIIARSPGVVKVLQQAMKVAAVDSTVLILGESGAGKGVIADLIHKYSGRSRRPMIKINCGAIPESLVESELFGYEKGAFTGADKHGKPGHLELADGGILFLDEVAELPLPSQVKLLRFLEDGCITRVGGTAHRELDVRILAATNRDLEAMVERKEFRRDLYYRLNVIPLHVPPLRERKECILPLIHHYLAHFAARLDRDKSLRLTRAASDALLAHPYPGNVRELMNLCERLVVMAEGDRITRDDLPGTMAPPPQSPRLTPDPRDGETPLHAVLDAAEREALARAMEIHHTQARAAKALGVNQSTIARKLKKHRLTASRP